MDFEDFEKLTYFSHHEVTSSNFSLKRWNDKDFDPFLG